MDSMEPMAKRQRILDMARELSPPSLIALGSSLSHTAQASGPHLGRIHKAFTNDIDRDYDPYNGDPDPSTDESADESTDESSLRRLVTHCRNACNMACAFDSTLIDARDISTKKLGLKLPLSESCIKKLTSRATISGYGDVATATTRVDPAIRSAMEISQMPGMDAVGNAILAHEDVVRIVSNIFDEHVRVKFKKLSIYLAADSGHFDAHVDTPKADGTFIGTMVIEFPTINGRDGGDLQMLIDGDSNWCSVDAAEGNDVSVAIFHPYIPHKITHVIRGARVSASFDIYRSVTAPEAEPSKSDLAETIAMAVRDIPNIGFILSQKYGLHQSLSGIDRRLKQALEKLGLQIIERFVRIDYEYSNDHYTSCYCDNNVYDTCQTTQLHGLDECIVFMMLSNNGLFELSCKSTAGGFTGNESAPTTREMKYYAKALIVIGK